MCLFAGLVTLAVAFQVQAVPAPAQPPRDSRIQQSAGPTGTAVIRGSVMTGDTGMPVRGATVTLMPVRRPSPATANTSSGTSAPSGQAQTSVDNGIAMDVATLTGRGKTTTTDASGGFQFKGVAAGTYRVSASPATYAGQYLSVAYGAKRPDTPGMFDPGQPIDVVDGQTLDKITIALQRGSVIAGRVVDDAGQPLARVSVYSLFYQPGSSRGMRIGIGSPTDDLGQFRIFGLAPGDYVVAAEGRNNVYVLPNTQTDADADRTGFLTTFYPGTPDESTAQRLHVGIGVEMPGVELRMVTGRLVHVSGTIVDSQGRPAHASGMLIHKTSMTSSESVSGFSTDADGRFRMRGVAPGDYRLVVRQTSQDQPGFDPASPLLEMATMPLSITDDIDNIVIRTALGATITGRIAFEGNPPARPADQAPPTIRVSAMPGDPLALTGPPPRPAVVGQDFTFTMSGLNGSYLLRSSTQGATLKAVLLGASEDITDTPREFKDGDKVTIVFTTQTSTLIGTVTDDKGAPAPEASVMLFSDNKDAWRTNSIHTRRGSTDSAGQFKLTGILPGRYFIVAAPRERLNIPSPDADFFEQLTKDATPVVVDQGEQRAVDLKLVTTSGG